MTTLDKVFVPHELKTIEVDVEKKIFRVNGEDFGSRCSGFTIGCQAGNKENWFDITVVINTNIVYANYGIDGKKTSEKVR